MAEESGKPKSNRIYLYALIVLVIILVGWIFMQRSKMTKLVNEKEAEKIELQHELDSVITEHNKIKQEYGALSDSLSAKDSIIQANAIEIRKLLDTQWEYNKVRKRLAMLQKIAQGYVHQIDSLYTVNRELVAENEKVRQDYRNEQVKTQTLMKDKEELNQKMTQAAVLRAYDVTVTPYRVKAGDKEQVTDKAARTDRLRVCFTIGENKLVPPGKKTIYIRITRPDNVVVQKTKYDNFMFNGQSVPYSLKQDIQFDGNSQNLCLVWNKKDNDIPAMKGIYSVTVFEEEREIGTGKFSLK